MITLRRADERGRSRTSWLDSRHTFSFADYYDPNHMGFRSLRVINDDVVAPGGGFGTHGHRDMEIITYVLEGALEHADSLGTGSVIRPGEVQKMSAGSGIRHSEFNHSKTEPVHFLQIWIVPERNGIEPSYEQLSLAPQSRRGELLLVAANESRDGLIRLHQDAKLYVGLLEDGQSVEHALAKGRHAWLHIARGEVDLNGQTLKAGDGAAITDEPRIQIRAVPQAEVLLFDLA